MNIEDFLKDIQENGVEEFDLTRIRHQLSMAAGYASYASEMVSNYQMRVDAASVKILQGMEESGEYKKYNDIFMLLLFNRLVRYIFKHTRFDYLHK